MADSDHYPVCVRLSYILYIIIIRKKIEGFSGDFHTSNLKYRKRNWQVWLLVITFGCIWSYLVVCTCISGPTHIHMLRLVVCNYIWLQFGYIWLYLVLHISPQPERSEPTVV